MMREFYTFNLNIFTDNRGTLVSLLDVDNIPFETKRIYYILDAKEGVSRGKLAHKSLEQILVCINGSCKVLLDNGEEKNIVELDKYDKALYINKYIWREMYDFSSDCILVSLNNEYYDENEIIRDYNEFLEFFKKVTQSK